MPHRFVRPTRVVSAEPIHRDGQSRTETTMALFHRPRRKAQARPTWRHTMPPSDGPHFDPSLRTAAAITAHPEQPPNASTGPAVARTGPAAA